jgi:hypothetical protein
MTIKEFLEKYPRPWRFEQTDRDGGGAILDANDQLMARLVGDDDWREGVPEDADPEDTKYRPVINGSGPVYGAKKPEDLEAEEERNWVIKILMNGVNQ